MAAANEKDKTTQTAAMTSFSLHFNACSTESVDYNKTSA